jgi:hypothetical protein
MVLGPRVGYRLHRAPTRISRALRGSGYLGKITSVIHGSLHFYPYSLPSSFTLST